eukprot:TRINITY_DN4476_c0_g1_i2.p1 TRINITY_DN4476_c0_g1~~TRINITY_DN4476_c0_g1_i2.p1  ORF type:complete len:829 (+),score=116.10 TRINITY_DN4476_c0_g1_i2:73-2559(+)
MSESNFLCRTLIYLIGFILFRNGIFVQLLEVTDMWEGRDSFDEVRAKYDAVNEDNCAIKHVADLKLPEDTVSHLPDIKEVNINPVFPNRTALLHLHNMALNRAFFFSYILQSRFHRPAINATYDPGMMYFFLSTIADVAANPKINSSGVYFSPEMAYTPSYKSFVNKTLPLFAPRTFRVDDYNDPIHLERISTLNTFEARDLGAIPDGNDGLNYTSNFYRINDWYKAWLPDDAHLKQLHDTKTVYDVRFRYANNTNASFSFHGPRGADENPGPVKWTRPYFDCGRSNEWKVAAVVPIADIFPRQTGFRHIEYPIYTAAAVLELNFERIDINQCPKGLGNDGPNRFADTAKCKKKTTECEPLHGYGFRRGGYQCRCKPSYRLPNVVRRPFLGEVLERASSKQFSTRFDCQKIGFIQKLPQQWVKSPKWLRNHYLEQFHEYKNFSTEGVPKTNVFERPGGAKINIDEVLKFMWSVDEYNCKDLSKKQLNLKGDVSWGADVQFKNEALMAVRLANFISSFLQVVDPNEFFHGTRVPDLPLTEDQMMGEALALVMGNTRIWSAGIYWDQNKFPNRTYFAPYAYKKILNTRRFHVEDLARLNKTDEIYTNNEEFYKVLKSRWSNYYGDLEKYWIKMFLRSKENGDDLYLRRYEHFPENYRAANIDHGYWTAPYFDCKGLVKMWKITYAVPFFGWDSLRNRIEFKGVVSVSMNLNMLDIDQCPDKYYVPNVFKDTQKCDEKTSYCVPILGRGFETGGYKCECKQGYEYPFEDPITYFDGQLLEAEFINMVKNVKTRFDMYKCRLATAAKEGIHFITVMFPVLLIAFSWFSLIRR